MQINKVSYDGKKTTMTLSSSEIIDICNALRAVSKSYTNNPGWEKMYSGLILARDLARDGVADDFCLKTMAILWEDGDVSCPNSGGPRS